MRRFSTGNNILRTSQIVKDTIPSTSNSGSQVSFKLVNNPPTIASLSISPHIPVYIRKGCLVSIFNNNDYSNLFIRNEFTNFWSNALNLSFNQYHKLYSNHNSFNCLVSTNTKINKNRQSTLYHLNLDGTMDWNVTGRDSILAFEKNTSLDIVPSSSLKFQNKLSNFNLLKGKGNLIINGIGSIIKIDLKSPNDEILLNTKNLLAISGKSQLDINKSIAEIKLSHGIVQNYRAQTLSAKKDYQFYKTLGHNIYHWLLLKFRLLKYGSPLKFVKITGPRNILIQSFNNTVIDPSIDYTLPPLPPDSSEASVGSKINDVKSDVKFANVYKDGRIKFESK
ncbi:hypothetical protein KAFR_0G01050 [Kazachstania africana CBS 2517]|uniref:Altered inheritance of mitochondria protein 24, mitochondrial n=1 Tax=Kazachstania africana (strain ATCC 22294 / BCRC 22015 / CBS 2517 / CECT 1963 / NBRC 1671 / NRRL Y-8276) TaxID=1071382 RepID=H2AXN8_KAZAF|nr:hypothetical protein KAFR_0G01050 [Kazachstania africana CBS 2517]CCF59138.1 hypothetical protein KAFR_0G01050 [Kazachstania africana CBS 2517]